MLIKNKILYQFGNVSRVTSLVWEEYRSLVWEGKDWSCCNIPAETLSSPDNLWQASIHIFCESLMNQCGMVWIFPLLVWINADYRKRE